MPWSDRPLEERESAEVAIEWALTGEAAELDLDLAIEVREAMEGPDWDRAWRAAAQLVVLCAEAIAQQEGEGRGAERLPWAGRAGRAGKKRRLPIEEELLVVEAKRLLAAEVR